MREVRTCWRVAAVAVCVAGLLPSAAGAGEVTTKELEKELKKTERKLEQLEKALEKLSSSRTRGTPAWPDTVARAQEQQGKRIAALEPLLAELPSEAAGVQAQLERLARVKASLAELAGDVAEGEAEQEALAKEWEAQRASAGYAADMEQLYGLERLEAFWFRLGDGRFGALDAGEFEQTLALVAEWPGLVARREALAQRYARFGRLAGSAQTHLEGAARAMQRCEEAMAAARRDGLGHLSELGRTLARDTQEVLTLQAQAQAAGRPFPLGYLLLDETASPPRRSARFVERTARYLIALEPSRAGDYAAAAATARAPYEEAVERATAEILASRKLPADDYAGEDRAELLAFARQACGGRLHGGELLAVRLSGRWERRQAWRWDPSAKAMVQIDRSSLGGWILVGVEGDAEHALLRRIDLERDHTREGALSLHGDFRDYPRPRVDQLLPRALLSGE